MGERHRTLYLPSKNGRTKHCKATCKMDRMIGLTVGVAMLMLTIPRWHQHKDVWRHKRVVNKTAPEQKDSLTVAVGFLNNKGGTDTCY